MVDGTRYIPNSEQKREKKQPYKYRLLDVPRISGGKHYPHNTEEVVTTFAEVQYAMKLRDQLRTLQQLRDTDSVGPKIESVSRDLRWTMEYLGIQDEEDELDGLDQEFNSLLLFDKMVVPDNFPSLEEFVRGARTFIDKSRISYNSSMTVHSIISNVSLTDFARYAKIDWSKYFLSNASESWSNGEDLDELDFHNFRAYTTRTNEELWKDVLSSEVKMREYYDMCKMMLNRLHHFYYAVKPIKINRKFEVYHGEREAFVIAALLNSGYTLSDEYDWIEVVCEKRVRVIKELDLQLDLGSTGDIVVFVLFPKMIPLLLHIFL